MSICVKLTSRPGIKVCLGFTALLLLLSSILASVYLGRSNQRPSDDDDYNEPPENPSCEVLTRTRSMDQYWECLVRGPTRFLLPREEVDPEPEPELSSKNEALRSIMTTKPGDKERNAGNNTLLRRRMKRAVPLPVPYQILDSEYRLAVSVLKVETRSTGSRIRANDPFPKTVPFLYRRILDRRQVDPPWSYQGHMGVKDWHKLKVENFVVPINPNLSLDPDDAMIQTVFTDFWDEDKLLTEAERAFRNSFFTLRTPDERITLYKLLYPKPFSDPRIKGMDFEPPRVINENNTHSDAKDDFIDVSKRVLHDNAIKDVLNIDNSSFSQLVQTKIFKLLPSMAFYIQARPSRKVLGDNKDHADLKKSVLPPRGANFDPIVALLEKLHSNIPEHALTAEEMARVELFTTAATELGFRPTPMGPKHWELSKWIFKEFITPALEQDAAASHYSLPVFPVRFPICQDKEPSPMDLYQDKALASSLTPYNFSENGDRFYKFRMVCPKDGTPYLTIIFADSSIVNDKGIKLTGGVTKNTPLYLEAVHLKVGDTIGQKGSEHSIDGKWYDMELQFMFTYDGLSSAQPYWFLLARQLNDFFPFREKLVQIVSILVEVDPNLNPHSAEALRFEALAQVAYGLRSQFESDPLGKHGHYRAYSTKDFVLRIQDFFPEGADAAYFAYRGGLTIPPCFSYVWWSVFKKPIKILPRQYRQFQQVPAAAQSSGYMGGNVRKSDDIWTAEENRPHLLPTQVEMLKGARINRKVLHSLVVGNIDNDFYDYYYDAHAVTISKPSILLLILTYCLLIVVFVFQI